MICLDSDTAIAIMNGVEEARRNVGRERRRGDEVAVSSIVMFELMYGAEHSARREHNLERVDAFLAGLSSVLPFDSEDATEAAKMRQELAAIGRPIGPYDILIAAQARRRGATLVTNNLREFSRVKNLRAVSWTKR